MKNDITRLIFAETDDIPSLPEETGEERKRTDNFLLMMKSLSSIVAEGTLVIDVQKRCFRYVSNHDLLLCGHSCEEVLRRGFDFYSEIVHPDDLPLMIEMYRAILQYPETEDENTAYFSGTFRIKSNDAIGWLMVYYRWKPVTIAGKRFIVCTMNDSAIPTVGHLRLYDQDQLNFKEYSFTAKTWRYVPVERLTDREKEILKLAKQGKKAREIAAILHVSYHTVWNDKKQILHKLNVHFFEEAMNYSSGHKLAL
ncbi:MAG: LuxR C-terminal-related transcriptional regulator [Bacteroidales bacterium]|jgi:DNA-binding CsgD family transcriptional regulator|nr:LuxR C-terminal-related transcriptional regulator [Bacteroidales bacterium]